jgi:transposase InsO family protein
MVIVCTHVLARVQMKEGVETRGLGLKMSRIPERGLPANIRSDNGVPFATAHALFNLSKLAVWWLRLGISIERIKPGHPQQNGRHERMHLTLKKEATKPSAANFRQCLISWRDADFSGLIRTVEPGYLPVSRLSPANGIFGSAA